MAKSAVETTKSWPEANARLREVRAAGYKATATDMGEHIVIHVTCGKKHADLSRLPLRKVVDLVPRQKEAGDISNFIDAHFGGKLGAFRSYRVKPDQVEPAPEPPGDGLVVAKQWIPAFAQSGASPPDPKSYQVRCARCGVVWPPAGENRVSATRKWAGLYRNLHAVTHSTDVLGDGLGAAVVKVEVRR